jgi:hypothetical protein
MWAWPSLWDDQQHASSLRLARMVATAAAASVAIRQRRMPDCHVGERHEQHAGRREASRQVPGAGHGMVAARADLAAAWPREGVGIAATPSTSIQDGEQVAARAFLSFPSSVNIEVGRQAGSDNGFSFLSTTMVFFRVIFLWIQDL